MRAKVDFPQPEFADHGESPAGLETEIHPIDRAQAGGRREETLPDPIDARETLGFEDGARFGLGRGG